MTTTRCVASTVTVLAAAALFSPAFPIAGVGAHYGLDFSLNMSDVKKEQASLGGLRLDTGYFDNTGNKPSGFTSQYLSGKNLPVYIERTGWQRNWFNLGGKLYVDVLPIIDALEISANYGMWQYNGSIIYPKSISYKATPTNPQDLFDITYDTTKITMKDLGLSNPFIKNTPYAKLQFDLTIRKYLLKLPPAANILKFYGGAGTSLFFATPVLTAGFIEKTLGNTLAATTNVKDLESNLFGGNTSAMKKLGRQFLKDLFTAHWGAHLDAGCMIKFPVLPVGIYIDGKLLIPFGSLDKNCPSLKATGILINGGLLYAL